MLGIISLFHIYKVHVEGKHADISYAKTSTRQGFCIYQLIHGVTNNIPDTQQQGKSYIFQTHKIILRFIPVIRFQAHLYFTDEIRRILKVKIHSFR